MFSGNWSSLGRHADSNPRDPQRTRVTGLEVGLKSPVTCGYLKSQLFPTHRCALLLCREHGFLLVSSHPDNSTLSQNLHGLKYAVPKFRPEFQKRPLEPILDLSWASRQLWKSSESGTARVPCEHVSQREIAVIGQLYLPHNDKLFWWCCQLLSVAAAKSDLLGNENRMGQHCRE